MAARSFARLAYGAHDAVLRALWDTSGRGASAAHSPVVCRTARRWEGPDSLLLPIAKSMAELASNADFSCIKACQDPPVRCSFSTERVGRRSGGAAWRFAVIERSRLPIAGENVGHVSNSRAG